MKTTLTAIAVVIAAMAILVLAACASRTEAPDAIAVQEQIAELTPFGRLRPVILVISTVFEWPLLANGVEKVGS